MKKDAALLWNNRLKNTSDLWNAYLVFQKMLLFSDVKYLDLVCSLSPTASKLCHGEISPFSFC